MTLHLGDVPASSTLYIPFDTISAAVGSVTITGLAVTDIEIYKNGSVTQRASDAGYALLDTDGIDFDGITGIHGFSVDLSNNTDAGFFAVGSFYWVIVSSITVDGQTVNFIAATFRIAAAEAIAGKPKVDVDAWLGTAAATPTVAGVPEIDLTHWNGTAIPGVDTAGYPRVTIKDGTGTGEIDTASGKVSIATGGILAASFAAGAIDAAAIATDAIDADAIAANAIDAGAIAAGAITAAKFAAGALDAAALATDAVTEIQSGLATAANLAIVAGYLDTEILAIKAKTDLIPAAPAAVGDIPTANQNADALLDRSAGVETGLTPRQWMRADAAMLFAKVSGGGTGTEVFRNAVADSKARVTVTVDNDGNRTAITTDLT